jgi:hypothetical protein
VRYVEIAKKALHGVMDSATAASQSNRVSAVRYMAARKVLISKWCINFLGLLIFAGSGQRPQVYASLEIPDHFDSTYLEWVNGTCCPKFAAGMEKTCRSSGFSSVVFPHWMHKVFHFHIKVVHEAIRSSRSTTDLLPAADSRFDIDDQVFHTGQPLCFSKTLLIHTETCEPYTTANVRCTLRRFIQYTHPELDNVTPMVIRSSFATWQFQRYRQKLCFRELREDEFLQKIAKVMNTSVEMLRSTYLAYSERDDDHLAAMREIHCMFDEE